MRATSWLLLAVVLGGVASASPGTAAAPAAAEVTAATTATTAAATAATTPATVAATIGDRLQRLDPSCRDRVVALLDSARADSLPVEPLLQRALEGQTKGAPGPRIVQAVQILVSRLRESRRLLGPARGEDELVAGAGCLGAGVDSTELRRIGMIRRSEPLVVPLIVLTDLISRGAPAETAVRVTLDMLGAGLGDRQLMDLRAGVQEDLRSGILPADAVLTRFRALSLPLAVPVVAPGAPGASRDRTTGQPNSRPGG
jgi:hypothetical protein